MTSDQTDPSGWPLTEAGIWLDQRMASLESPRPALFLDRDGVIVRDTGFLSDPSAVALVPGMAALIKRANDAHIPVLVVTNQSGIDRGLFGWEAFQAVESQIATLLSQQSAVTNATAACPFHPDHTENYGPEQARWRKPEPGMIEALANILTIDLSRSCLIGDRARDLEAARKAGLAGGFLFTDPSDPDAVTYCRTATTAGFSVEAGDSMVLAQDWLDRSSLFQTP